MLAYTRRMTKTFWNERYSGAELVYGEAPNEFLAMIADRLPSERPNCSAHRLRLGPPAFASEVFQPLEIGVVEVHLERLGHDAGLYPIMNYT